MKKYFMIFVMIFALSFLFCQNFSLEKISTTGYNDPFFTFNIWNSFECSFFAITDKLDVEYNNYVLEKKDGFPFLCMENNIPTFVTKNNKEKKIMILSGQILDDNKKSTSFIPSVTLCFNSGFYNYTMSSSLINEQAYSYINQTSFLKKNDKIYSVENLSCINPNTPWVEGVAGNGIGEGFTIEYKSKNDNYILIINGYISYENPYLYEQNSRIKKIKVTGLQSNKSSILEVLDTPHPQTVDISILEETEGFSVEIVDVYPGTKYEDTCIHYFVPFENQVIPYE